ncbi:MAG: rod shape-determining protein MreD [Clostridia bacterium]|nr:rod shape-determining protein MreD [Clostridia bacterium]
MTRHNQYFKWLMYLLALLPVWFLETALLRRVPVFGVFPMLLPFAVVAVAVLEGAVSGAAFGLAVGILCDVAYYGTGGSMTIGLALVGAATGLMTQYALRQNFWGFLLCSCGALTALDTLRVLRRLLGGMAPLVPLLRVAVPEVLWSLVFAPAVYILFRFVRRRIGGTALI